MNRWTKKQLDNISDLDFAICTLNERKNKLTFYSLESARIRSAIATINDLREQKYIILNLDDEIRDYKGVKRYNLEGVIDFANIIREMFTENFNRIETLDKAKEILDSCSYLVLPLCEV